MNPAALHRDALVIDAHTHVPRLVPGIPGRLYRGVNRLTMPAEVPFGALPETGVDAVVAKAVGDPIVTRWYRGGPWAAVLRQLERIEAEANDGGARMASSAADIEEVRRAGRVAVVLGLEGADALEGNLERVDSLYERGVRIVVLVHLGDNDLGTTCLPWQRYLGPLPGRRRSDRGLTRFGAAVTERMNTLGMVIDAAHSDTETVLDIAARSSKPIISSHTGARARSDFARFLTDAELRAIAGSGGVVGLWPYRFRRTGIRDLDDLVGHARYIADLVGPEHLCLGTDMNGVPGVMDGYRGERDLPKVTAALVAHGFTEHEVRGILGANVARVLAAQ